MIAHDVKLQRRPRVGRQLESNASGSGTRTQNTCAQSCIRALTIAHVQALHDAAGLEFSEMDLSDLLAQFPAPVRKNTSVANLAVVFYRYGCGASLS